jgi:hypothetical protein
VDRICKACGGTGVIERKSRKKKQVKKSFPSYVAPGPFPLGDRGDSSLQEGEDEELSYLVGNWKIFQKLGRHRYSTDDLVTTWIACDEAKRLKFIQPLLLDIGCGLGSVLLSNAWQLPDATCVGVEAQEDRFSQALRSIAYNVGYYPSEQTRICVHHHDLRENHPLLTLHYPRGFDMVTGTPPYFAPHLSGQPGCIETAGCLFELRGGVEEYCIAAAKYLRPPPVPQTHTTATASPCCTDMDTHQEEPPSIKSSGGTPAMVPSVFVLVNTALASTRVYLGCEAAGLTIVRRLDVIPRDGKPPLFCVFVIVLDSWLQECESRNDDSFPPLSAFAPGPVADLLPANAREGLRVEGSVRGEVCEIMTVRESNLEHTAEYAQLLRDLGKPSSFDKEVYHTEEAAGAEEKQSDLMNHKSDQNS